MMRRTVELTWENARRGAEENCKVDSNELSISNNYVECHVEHD